MNLKIVSDGTTRNTKVVNAETGEELENVARVRFEVDNFSAPYVDVELSLIRVPLEIEASGRALPHRLEGDWIRDLVIADLNRIASEYPHADKEQLMELVGRHLTMLALTGRAQ